MEPYLALLERVLVQGEPMPSRCHLASTGAPVGVRSLLGAPQVHLNLREGFPVVTTKRLAFGAVVEELLWFLSGSTNVRALEAKGVRIWSPWADEHGELGPIYGQNWRAWEYLRTDEEICEIERDPEAMGALTSHVCVGAVDQIATLCRQFVEARDNPSAPCARRLLLQSWNPGVLHRQRLPACHVLAQFFVRNAELSCNVYQRSGDVFLGVPFNLASYALLTHLFAQASDLGVGELHFTFGDLHLYDNCVEQAREQLSRTPRKRPRLWIRDRGRGVDLLDQVQADDIQLIGYDPHDALRAEVAV